MGRRVLGPFITSWRLWFLKVGLAGKCWNSRDFRVRTMRICLREVKGIKGSGTEKSALLGFTPETSLFFRPWSSRYCCHSCGFTGTDLPLASSFLSFLSCPLFKSSLPLLWNWHSTVSHSVRAILFFISILPIIGVILLYKIRKVSHWMSTS